MILVDTSIWIDHLRVGDAELDKLLQEDRVLTHPFVIGELAVGAISPRDAFLDALRDLPRVGTATDEEVWGFIERQRLFGGGLGYVDVHLLAAVRLSAGAALWTRDRHLHDAAARIGLAAISSRTERPH